MARGRLITDAEMDQAIQEALDGISYSKAYQKVFTESDWSESDGQYTITIASSEHELLNVNTVDLFKLANDEYITSHGVFDNLDYTININSDNTVNIITTSAFSGKVILICNTDGLPGGSSDEEMMTLINKNSEDIANIQNTLSGMEDILAQI